MLDLQDFALILSISMNFLLKFLNRSNLGGIVDIDVNVWYNFEASYDLFCYFMM